MANSEVFPSSLFPLRGDLLAESGATTVEVIGLQDVPIAPQPFVDGYSLTFVESNNDLEWLPDIDIFNPDNTFFVSLVAGDVLVYNGFDWTNAPLPFAQTFAPVTHEFLTGYNATTGLFTAGQPALGGLSDVSLVSLVTGDILVWNGSAWINELYDPSLDVAWSNLQSTLSNGQVIPYADAGISRLGAASLAIGNGTAGDFSGALSLGTITVGDFASLPAYLKTNPLVEGVLPSLNTVSGTIPSDSTNVGISTAVQSGGFGLGLTVYTLASGIGGGAYAIEAEAALASGTTGGNATALAGDLYIEDNTVTNCTAYGVSFGLWPAGGAGNYFYGSSVYIGSSGTATGVVEAICYQATNAYADPSSGTAIGLLIRSAISGATRYAIKSDTTAQSAFNGVIGWQNPGLTAIDAGISRLGAASLAIGNGTAGDFTGKLKLSTVWAVGAGVLTGGVGSSVAEFGQTATAISEQLQVVGIFCKTTQTGYAFSIQNEGGAQVFNIGTTGGISIYNDSSFGSNNAIFGAAQGVRINSSGVNMAAAGSINWSGTTHAYDTFDSGISRLGAASLAIGNGMQGDFTGSLTLTGLNVQGSQTGPYSVSLTAQAATIAATNLVTTPVTTALYEITYYLNDTTAGTSGTVSLTITWNDGGSQTFTSSNVTFGTLGAYVSGTIVVKATSGAIQYATTVTSAVGSPAYSLDIRIKQLA